ncbi:hypothetical protein TNIN_457551 [Trichonephila inaurata madagascariensis]|uniref:Uncharacterized protein n=1 Tax=Trichonephila inaurata madagascariensis TaxID=2747483 RepID=A0A8X6WZY9_9ARAC|nr:hypothetical protein TNIN_457551 [Trichonephila inaurata madagascariensis]
MWNSSHGREREEARVRDYEQSGFIFLITVRLEELMQIQSIASMCCRKFERGHRSSPYHVLIGCCGMLINPQESGLKENSHRLRGY